MNLFFRDDELVIVGLSINLLARPTSPTQRPMGGSDCQNGSVAGQLEINFRVFDSVSSSTTHNPLKPTRPVRSLKIRQKTQPVRSFHFSDFYTLSPSVSYFHALSFSDLSLSQIPKPNPSYSCRHGQVFLLPPLSSSSCSNPSRSLL